MNNKIKKTLSFCKAILFAVFHIIIFPVYFVLPKYENYIFVLTTGRSGSGNLANLFKSSKIINSFHEPYPILSNYFNLEGAIYKLWLRFNFYLIKYPRILFTRLSGEPIYLETNHLFLKSFSNFAVKVFKNKIRVIHLTRKAELVAKSMFEIGKIPGSELGNRWYLSPSSSENLLDFNEIYNALKDYRKADFIDLYKCLWYWHEMEARIDYFKRIHKVPVVEVKTEELAATAVIVEKINMLSNFDIPNLEIETEQIDKNLKKDEKIRFIDLNIVNEKNIIFQNAISKWKKI